MTFRHRVYGNHKRFVGNGNVWVGDGRYRGWQAHCSECDKIKVVTSHNSGGQLPPKMLLRKFGEAGWFIGEAAEDDLCKECFKSYREEQKVERESKKAARAAAAEAVATARKNISNPALEMALLLKEALDKHDYDFAREAALEVIALIPSNKPMTTEPPPSHMAFIDKFKQLNPKDGAQLVIDEFGPNTAAEIANAMIDELEEKTEKEDRYDAGGSRIQTGSHIDSMPKQPSLPVNGAPVVVAPERKKKEKAPEPEEDFDAWLAEQQMLHDQKRRTMKDDD